MSRSDGSAAKLIAAARQTLATTAYDDLTVRLVAKEAGVAPATAYNHFKSKQHLVAATYLDLLETNPIQDPPAGDAHERLSNLFTRLLGLLDDCPEIAAAATVAMLADQPDVKQVRTRIGRLMRANLSKALAPDGDVDERVLTTLEIAWAGALMRSGLGHIPREQTTKELNDPAHLVLKGSQ